MQTFFNDAGQCVNKLAGATTSFTPEAWATLAVAVVVLGYFLLRGNIMK